MTNNTNEGQYAEIKDARDYAIRNGRVLEKFAQDFYTRYHKNTLYTHVLEMLIRDADPYEIIEKLIEINDEQLQKINELMPFVSPNYSLWKAKQPDLKYDFPLDPNKKPQ